MNFSTIAPDCPLAPKFALIPTDSHGIGQPDDVAGDLQTGRVLQQWLPEIPVRSLLASYELTGQDLGKGGFGSVVVARKK